MKLYQRRSTDYFRNANASDRRYLLYNPTSKMKVTLQAEDVINLLWEVIAAFQAGGNGSRQCSTDPQVHEELFLWIRCFLCRWERCSPFMLIKAAGDDAQYERVWNKYVYVLNGEYAMNE